ncbi:MAG TPA: CvpA family protein [Anaerovoracaceae bacterium]|nr:CvpA family protein [Anaerovoracaceae bacterium]
MVMDIIIAVILLASIILGVRGGFTHTVLNCMHWVVGLAVGFFFCDNVKDFLVEKTLIDDTINAKIASTMSASLAEDATYQSIPTLYSDSLDSAGDTFIYNAVLSMTGILMTIISFLLIIFAIKIICFFLNRLFSKKYNGGIVGFVDGFAGFVAGTVRGGILVLVFLALLVPILGLILPSLVPDVMEALDKSYVAGTLYDNNLLLVLIRDLFA